MIGRRLLLGIIVFVSGCSEERSSSPGSLAIVCTTGIVGDLVKVIAGDVAEITTLIEPGQDPHRYRASKDDVERLSQADAIFHNGLDLEEQMQEILERLVTGKKVVAISRDIPRDRLRGRPGLDGLYDPHVWLDVALWKEAVGPVVAALSELRPDLYADFKVRGEAYRARLDTLHHQIADEIQSVPDTDRVLITAHAAFGYFGQAYGIKAVSVQGVTTSAEYAATDVTRIVDLILASRVKTVFAETCVPGQSIQAVLAASRARGINVGLGGILYSDALGDVGSGTDTYVAAVEATAHTIAEILRPGEPSSHDASARN